MQAPYQCRAHVEGKSSSPSDPGCCFLSLLEAKGWWAGSGAATRSNPQHVSCHYLSWQDVIAESRAVIVRRWAFLSSLKGLCPFSKTNPPFFSVPNQHKEKGTLGQLQVEKDSYPFHPLLLSVAGCSL